MAAVWYLIGASGSGKSTRASELVAELGPGTCLIATDVIRAQLRAVLDRETYPELWAESFNVPPDSGDGNVNIEGFLRQCAPILRAVEAGVDYALTEGWSVVVEGVHLVPGEFELTAAPGADLHVELRVVEHADQHKALFSARDIASDGGRAAAHYHANLPRIRQVQQLLVDRWHEWSTKPADAARAKLVQVEPRA